MSIHFEPAPANDFAEYIETYFTRSRAACPKIIGIAGKWKFEDLIPGLSDFDTRFICTGPIDADEWVKMGLAVGKVHGALASERPEWMRNLEHLPGLNLTVDEMCDPAFYYPEFQQWTFYHGERSALDRIQAALAARKWSQRDEVFHLKKIGYYIGPYQRGIDPAINLGKWESKYPLHSRFMHYFAPAVQSAMSVAHRRNIAGKVEAIRMAQAMLPGEKSLARVVEGLDHHYENPEWYNEPRLTDIERVLEEGLMRIARSLAPRVTATTLDDVTTPDAYRQRIATIAVDPVEQFFEGVKFCRFMKGRLIFYATCDKRFDSPPLIHNELRRIVANFYEKPLATYGKVRWGEKLSPSDVLDRLTGDLITFADARQLNSFADIGRRDPTGCERSLAMELSHPCDAVVRVLERVGQDLRDRTRSRGT